MPFGGTAVVFNLSAEDQTFRKQRQFLHGLSMCEPHLLSGLLPLKQSYDPCISKTANLNVGENATWK